MRTDALASRPCLEVSLRQALVLKVVRPRPPRPPLYGEAVIEALRFCWAVQGTPCGRLLAAALPDLVPRLRRFKELGIDDAAAELLLRIAPATIDRRLKGDRAKLDPQGRSHTKPGPLLKDSIPMRTYAVNCSEIINWELFRWCEQENLTFTRSGNNNDGAHAEQKNWHIVRETTVYHCYDTAAEMELLNRIWELQRLLTNHSGPQQKLVKTIRTGAKITKKYDLPATQDQRVVTDTVSVKKAVTTKLAKGNKPLNPAAIQRQIQRLASERLTLTPAKRGPKNQPSPRALSNDSTKKTTRAS